MTTITLQAIEARQSELVDMIATFKAQTGSTILVPEQTITLRPGEHYVGTTLNADGTVKHHLILMAARPEGRLTWQAAMNWAEEVGGALPDRQEQALLFANCKPHLKPEWHWSSEAHEDDASYAWDCTFHHGHQYHYHKSYEGCAVAVRRS